MVLALLTAGALTATADTQGPARWDKPVLAVNVADAAWAGTDVGASLAEWAPAFPVVLTDDPGADIVLTVGPNRPMAGATAHLKVEGSTITGCRVDLDADFAGKDVGYVLTHELGHCLGYASPATGSRHEHDEVSVMATGDFAENLSHTVTASDIAAVKALYR